MHLHAHRDGHTEMPPRAPKQTHTRSRRRIAALAGVEPGRWRVSQPDADLSVQ